MPWKPSSKTPPRPVGELSSEASSELLWAGGRVVESAPNEAVLADALGAAKLRFVVDPPVSLPLGWWVAVEGHWDGREFLAVDWRALQQAGLGFASADSDWRRFQDQGRRRSRRLQERQTIVKGLRQSLFDWGFLEVDTPALVATPALEPHIVALQVDTEPPQWLATSPEYGLKRLLVAGFPRIFQLGKAFRGDESGTLHEPEFTLLEWYRAYAEVEDLMDDTEQLLLGTLGRPADGRPAEDPPGLVVGGADIDLTPPWRRMTVDEAMLKYAGVSAAAASVDEANFFRLLAEVVQPQLGRDRPVFLVEWPVAFAALARRCSHNPMVAERFELYIAGVELCNGYGELCDPVEQRQRLVVEQQRRHRQGEVVGSVDERFLLALEAGMPPCSGNALGVDRWLMLALGESDLDAVIAFPQHRCR